MIKTKDYNSLVQKLREFFLHRGFLEVPVQSRLSILAACEDPYTVKKFNWRGEDWPLPQTGQMWLEHELLKSPESSGFYCISTSYRQEENPIAGRHETIFPMFEFEMPGSNLYGLERELVEHLGFWGGEGAGAKYCYPLISYMDSVAKYGVLEIGVEQEEKLCEEFGSVVFLENFPQYTSPFWNMKREGNISKKIDVIMHGMETIGSAERSCDPVAMRTSFETISEGQYAQLLYDKFGESRVKDELDDFLSSTFFPRCGGGIGITRLIRAMKLEGLLETA